MANVLPPEALHAVRNFYRDRFVFVGSVAGIACGTIALLVLVPAYAIIHAEQGSGEGSEAVTLSSPLNATDREEVTHTQLLVRELRPVASSSVSALQILDAALGARPTKVIISNLSYTRGDPGTIVLGGSAPSREEISAYRTVLSKDPHFKTVSVPIGILAASEDGRFTITLTGTF